MWSLLRYSESLPDSHIAEKTPMEAMQLIRIDYGSPDLHDPFFASNITLFNSEATPSS